MKNGSSYATKAARAICRAQISHTLVSEEEPEQNDHRDRHAQITKAKFLFPSKPPTRTERNYFAYVVETVCTISRDMLPKLCAGHLGLSSSRSRDAVPNLAVGLVLSSFVSPRVARIAQKDDDGAEAGTALNLGATSAPDDSTLDQVEMPLPSDLRTAFEGGLFLLALLAALYATREIALPVVLAFVLRLVLQPAVRLLERLRVPRVLGALLLISLLLGAVDTLGTALYGPAASWAAKTAGGHPPLAGTSSVLAGADRSGSQFSAVGRGLRHGPTAVRRLGNTASNRR